MLVKKKLSFPPIIDIQIENGGVSFIVRHNGIETTIEVIFIGNFLNHQIVLVLIEQQNNIP